MSQNLKDKKFDALCQKTLDMPIIKEAFRVLEQGLSNDLLYHSVEHSRDVLQEVLHLSLYDELDERDIHLLTIGAAFHDTGFIHKPIENEELGAQIAQEAMNRFGGYSVSEIEIVREMILDTRFVNVSQPHLTSIISPLGRYLIDADVGNLGREDFFDKSELLRQEIGLARHLFYPDVLNFIESHLWLTRAGRELWRVPQQENVRRLREYTLSLQKLGTDSQEEGLEVSQLLSLSRLPLLLNSSLQPEIVVRQALKHLCNEIQAEAGTVFLLDDGGKSLRFWALQGDEASLQDRRLPSDQGLVGWVIQNKQSLVSQDPKSDARFYRGFDEEGGFQTRNLICVPLLVREREIIGAVQILNKKGDAIFSDRDLLFCERFGSQLALAVDNAILFQRANQMHGQLTRLDKRKGEMITVLTHELRTPLNVIQGAADILAHLGAADDKTRDKMGQTLQRGVARLVKLSQQLQSLSRIEGNRVSVQKTSFSLGQMLQTLEERFKTPLEVRHLHFVVECTQRELMVQADEALLTLVLGNLLSNAIRFTEDEGTITLRIWSEHGLVHFEVEDTGIGIPESEHQLIFEKFYEVGDALVHSSGDYGFRSGGLGLGLSTAKAILEAHDSSLAVQSTEGSGSLFSFRLPMKRIKEDCSLTQS
ncbi:MAG: ATP-binding protein [Bdellovibrionota bacterium]